MEEQDAVAKERGSPELGFSLPASDEKVVTGLSTILVASIQEAKDRISQIEYVFCSQLYPHFQSNSNKLSQDILAKRRRIDQLEREVDEGMTLHKSLMDLVKSKESSLRDTEAKLVSCENEKAILLRRIDELDEKLGDKSREIEGMRERVELKRVEEEDSYLKVLERVESLTCELQGEKMKRNRITEAYKRLKSQHIYLRRKVGLTEENVLQQNKSEGETDLASHQSPITEHGLAFENPDMTMYVCEVAEVKSEIPEEDYGGLEKKTPDVFVSVHDTNEAKEKTSEDDRGANLSSPSSGFRGVPKCPSSTKLVSISGTKRPVSSWRQTRSHQSRADADLHDDFLDTPLENIRENLNKDSNKEEVPYLIQTDISVDSSDDETQDMNAKSSPQKKQSSITVANKGSFKYIEPVRKKAERENLNGVECKQCRKFYDAVLPNADGKDTGSSKQNFRCEHHDGVSRHRYRYVPPMTPEGFWNIGFESEI